MPPPRACSPFRTDVGRLLESTPPPPPPPGLRRTGSLKRELGIPQKEAAASLRRAMSCYPELAGEGGAEGDAAGGRGRGGGLTPELADTSQGSHRLAA